MHSELQSPVCQELAKYLCLKQNTTKRPKIESIYYFYKRGTATILYSTVL
jgi:hypothetical protein